MATYAVECNGCVGSVRLRKRLVINSTRGGGERPLGGGNKILHIQRRGDEK